MFGYLKLIAPRLVSLYLYLGTLMQIWKSTNIFSSYENNMLKILH